ncbi:hypothetical protein LCGC14_1567740 [marine sediment metagenome]|uniref:Uncharacterized protein n=1 Tax=marine sediment metagenome TaxID=412755 RepID=A0A0F9J6U9_9ZZZZ
MPYIKFYLTSLEPNLAQTIRSQSIGGYPSNSLVYPEATLLSSIGLYDMFLTLEDYIALSGEEYISINSEIIKVSPISNNVVSIQQRGVNDILNVHVVSDLVKGGTINKIFNDTFNDSYKQYRCIAVKNISDNVDPSANLISYNMEVYLVQGSRNINTDIKMAIEIPKSQYFKGFSTSWTNISLIDISLIGGTLQDNDCKDAYLRILSGPNSGRNRLISSYDSSTGIFIFYDSLAVDYSSSYNYIIEYEVEPTPAQRIKTGTESPSFGTGYVSNLSAFTESSPVGINLTNKTDGNNLYSKDVIYVWLERTIRKGSEIFNANNSIIGLKYSIN